MNLAKIRDRCAPLLDISETLVAAAKVSPRGSAYEVILGAAGAVGGGAVSPTLAGAGAVVGAGAAASLGDAGRVERSDLGLDVGRATQVLLGVTDCRVVLVQLSALGRPKTIMASVDLARIERVALGETSLLGQKMTEIVFTFAGAAETGFGAAKIHRGDAERVVAEIQSRI